LFSEELVNRLKNARYVAVLTGAGISAESGVPTFRGEGGLWKNYKAEDLASFEGFMRNPGLVWEWYNMRKKVIGNVECNPGHIALSKMEELVPEFWLITQNVDGLHKRAGSKNVIELHRNIMRSKCINCGKIIKENNFPAPNDLPKCECGGLLRPDVVWFGEMLQADIIDKAFDSAHKCDVFFSVGTSAIVQPAASLPVIALDSGAYVAEINTERTPVSSIVNEVINYPSGKVLPEIVNRTWGKSAL